MPEPAPQVCETGSGCITCGDVAVPLRIVELDAGRELALCEDERGRRETVEIALVQPVAVGDELLVHAGTAIQRLEGVPASPQGAARGDAALATPPRTRGREAEHVRDVSGDPRSPASPQGAARGDAVEEGSP